MASLEVRRGDITTMRVDAVVDAANRQLRGGGGVDGAVHAAGGPTILAECRTIIAEQGECRPGNAVATSAGALPARIVVHAVGPIWTADDGQRHDRTLAAAYTSSLDTAAANGARTIAFPNISTGVYGFPKPRAAEIAVHAVRRHLPRSRRSTTSASCASTRRTSSSTPHSSTTRLDRDRGASGAEGPRRPCRAARCRCRTSVTAHTTDSPRRSRIPR